MLTLWDPFVELSRIHRNLFSEWSENPPEFKPSVDICEEEKAFRVKADLAGLKPEDIKIELNNNILTVRGERKLEKEDEQKGYRLVERRYGSFCRSFALPETVEAESIDASYVDGVLTVTLPKRAESRPREIKISTH